MTSKCSGPCWSEAEKSSDRSAPLLLIVITVICHGSVMLFLCLTTCTSFFSCGISSRVLRKVPHTETALFISLVGFFRAFFTHDGDTTTVVKKINKSTTVWMMRLFASDFCEIGVVYHCGEVSSASSQCVAAHMSVMWSPYTDPFQKKIK